jgi:hypothetical protein
VADDDRRSSPFRLQMAADPAADQRSPSASPVDTQNIQICTASVLTGIELTSASL